jgi:hypothetical protein
MSELCVKYRLHQVYAAFAPVGHPRTCPNLSHELILEATSQLIEGLITSIGYMPVVFDVSRSRTLQYNQQTS